MLSNILGILNHLVFFHCCCAKCRFFDAAQLFFLDLTLFTCEILKQVQDTVKHLKNFLSEVKYKVRLHSQMTWTQVTNGHELKVHNIPELNHQQGNTEVIKVKYWNHFTTSSGGNTEHYCQNKSHATEVTKLGRWTSLDSSTLSTWTIFQPWVTVFHLSRPQLDFKL